MTYTHLTTDELVMIASYFKIGAPITSVACNLQRSKQTIYKMYHFE